MRYTVGLRILGIFALSAAMFAAFSAFSKPFAQCKRQQRAEKYAHRTLKPEPGNRSRPAQRSLDDLFMSADVPKEIPDGPGGIVTSVLTVDNPDPIEKLNVYLEVTHTWVRDLRVSLIAPNDITEVVLIDLFPGDSIVNLKGWFDEDEAVWINDAVPDADTTFVIIDTTDIDTIVTFTLRGAWQPLENLHAFDTVSASGTWTLRVEDRLAADTGTVQAWGIDINPAPLLTGTVTNSMTSTPIPNVTVRVVEAEVSTFTGVDGNYTFSRIPEGTYTVQFTKYHYDTSTVEDVPIVTGELYTLDVQMDPIGNFVEIFSTSESVPIPDYSETSPDDSAYMQLSVSQELYGVIADLDVTVNITHTYATDLDLVLVSPTGIRDTLIINLPYNGDSLAEADFENCWFDDEAELSIYDADREYHGGPWRPARPLSMFDGVNTRGTWTLIARDNWEFDEGTIDNFTLLVEMVVPVEETPSQIPADFGLLSNYPNPFNAVTTLEFYLNRSLHVELTIFDLTGRQIGILIDQSLRAGHHEVVFNAADLPSGMYFARLSAGGEARSRKMILLK